MQVLQFSRDLAIPGIEAVPCGCLGGLWENLPPASCVVDGEETLPPHMGSSPAAAQPTPATHNLAGACGSGPNVAVIPLDGTTPLVLRHISTPQRAADVLREVCCTQVGIAHGRAGCAGKLLNPGCAPGTRWQ